MDPDATLELIRDAVRQGNDLSKSLVYRNSSYEVASDYFNELDKWLSRGGFLPTDWNANR